jgi:outer membrane protein assembly factor BamB
MARRRAHTAAAAVLVLATAAGCQGWPQAGFGPGKASFNGSEVDLTANRAGELDHVWSVDIGGVDEVVEAGGRVHVLTASAFAPPAIRTLDAATGTELWSREVGGDFPADYVVVRDGVVHTRRVLVGLCSPTDPTCSINFVHDGLAFDAATGADRPPLVGQAITLGLHHDDVAFGVRTAVLEGTTGPRSDDLFVHDLADPAVAPTRLVGSASVPDRAAALDERRGLAFAGTAPLAAWPTSCPGGACATAWTFTGTGPLTPPVVDDRGVYVIDSGEGMLRTLDPATGTPRWSASVGLPASPVRPAVRHGTVYVAGSASTLVVFEDCGEPTCEAVWQAGGPPTMAVTVTPVVAGDAVYTLRSAGERHESRLDVFDADGCGAPFCSPVASRGVTGDPLGLLVGDGRVIVRTTSGLHAFGLPA